MSKEQILEIIKLLSAVESWSFTKESTGFPDYLHERLSDVLDALSKEVLK